MKEQKDTAPEKMTPEERRSFLGMLMRLLAVREKKNPESASPNGPEAPEKAAPETAEKPAAPKGDASENNAVEENTARAEEIPEEAPEEAKSASVPVSDDGEKEARLRELCADERLPGFADKLPETERLLNALPEFDRFPVRNRYLLGYFIAVGMEAAKEKGKRPTAEELVTALTEREDAVKLYEMQRLEKLAQQNGAIPKHAGSKGAASMPVNIKKAPKNLSEARKEAYSYFGIQ